MSTCHADHLHTTCADHLLGREYEVDLQRFVVGAVDPQRGVKLYPTSGSTWATSAVWVSFAFWRELRDSGLLQDARPLCRAMPAVRFWVGVK